MRNRTWVAIGSALLAGAALAPSAGAVIGAGDTTATFGLTNGSISMTTPSAATLSTWASSPLVNGVTVSGSLGSTTVTDQRNVTTGWAVSASSTNFVTVDGSGNPDNVNGQPRGSVPASQVTISIPTLAGVTQVVNGVSGALTNGLFIATPGGTTGAAGGTIGQLVGSELLSALGGIGALLGKTANNAITYAPSVSVRVPPNTPDGTYRATITQTAA